MSERELLLVPGPTMVEAEVLEALAQEPLSHVDPRFVAIYVEALSQTRRLFQLTGGAVFLLAGSGTLAMEMALVNTVAPGERVLVVSHGYFGDRFARIAAAFGIQADLLSAPWGQRVPAEEVAAALQSQCYRAVTVTHVDTSTGVEADLPSLVPLVKAHGALFLLDGVCATGGIEEKMGKTYGDPSYTIDLVFSGSQKALGLPPGLFLLAMGERALAARRAMPSIPAYYADALNWLPVMEDPSRYFATPPVNMVTAYRKAMQRLFAEGLEMRYLRHRVQGQAVRAALRSIGFTPLAEEDVAASTVSCLRYPAGLDDASFRGGLARRGVIVAGGLAETKGLAFRLGHLGNVGSAELRRALAHISQTMVELGAHLDLPVVLEVFDEVMTGGLEVGR